MAEQWNAEIADLKASSPLVTQTPWFRQNYLGEWVIDLDKLVYRFNPDRNSSTAHIVPLAGVEGRHLYPTVPLLAAKEYESPDGSLVS